MRSTEEVARVFVMLGQGVSDWEIARRTGISRSTIRNWRVGGKPGGKWPGDGTRIDNSYADRPTDVQAYSYLLGLYLGDGHIASPGHACWLRLCLDAKYPTIVSDAAAAMSRVLPVQVRLYDKIGRGNDRRSCLLS